MKIYGIKNCDTVKKALKWLTENGITPELHDYRTNGLDENWLVAVEAYFGWETLVNKKSTTWRNLDASVKDNLNRETALAVLREQPTLIKRPIIFDGTGGVIGFSADSYQAFFQK